LLAQQGARVRHVGVLYGASASQGTDPATKRIAAAFREGLAENFLSVGRKSGRSLAGAHR
jgi:hypothetical protein